MKTLEQLTAEADFIARLPECCAKCKFFGRAAHPDREPSGECHRKAPGEKYVVHEIIPATIFGPGAFMRRPLEIAWPPVAPWDHCGEFVERPAEDDTTAPPLVVQGGQ